MFKYFLLIISLSIMLFAYSDKDIDGVDDKTDKCPNTPFYELVDSTGCSISSLESKQKFDFIYGISFSQSDYLSSNSNVTYQNFQFDYYHNALSLELSTSFSMSGDEKSLSDSYVGINYQFLPTKNLKIKTGFGVILPTYDTNLNNNNTDYTATISTSYSFEKINIFAGYNYTNVNDDDVNTTDIQASYQDTNSFSAGIGFNPTDDTYLSISYFTGESIYIGEENIDTASLYYFYSLNQKWFTTFSYALGLSDSASDTYLSIKVGYNF